MKFIRHTGQTIATTVIRTPTVEKKEKENYKESTTLTPTHSAKTVQTLRLMAVTDILSQIL